MKIILLVAYGKGDNISSHGYGLQVIGKLKIKPKTRYKLIRKIKKLIYG